MRQFERHRDNRDRQETDRETGTDRQTDRHRQTNRKGGYRRAEKSRKVLMMMKAAKLDLAEPEPGAGRRRVGVGQDQGKSRVEAGAGEE